MRRSAPGAPGPPTGAAEESGGTGRNLLIRGCRPELAVDARGEIIASGRWAEAAAGPTAERLELEGEALPGLADSHIHLEWMAQRRRWCDLSGCRTAEEVRRDLGEFCRLRRSPAFLVASGLDRGLGLRALTRQALDEVGGGRPLLVLAGDAHSGWASTAALVLDGIGPDSAAPRGGVVGRDEGGEPTGFLGEMALWSLIRHLPQPSPEEAEEATEQVLSELAELGLTSIHVMDSGAGFSTLQRLQERGRLRLRVSWFAPIDLLPELIRLQMRSGWGDERLRLWGVKAFLDGTLGSDTAELLAGGGMVVTEQSDLIRLTRQIASSGLNLALHAIGDGAVRRALDAFAPWRGAHPRWRPRIEHAQLVEAGDRDRFAPLGVIASMQPVHARSDRELARARWSGRGADMYAWGALARSGTQLAFGSDAPMESADPLLGLSTAVDWRAQVAWHPELALSPDQALKAYTWGAAYAVGMEARLGSLDPGRLCDLTVVKAGRVVASVVAGRLITPP
ncbi:MAG TPA: amidohydrolase [Candidatus Nitrosotalea sp.]|nr:amidohydrolase [Candidatus Nitrosotalea sp.]